jgi:hypothetical protein
MKNLLLAIILTFILSSGKVALPKDNFGFTPEEIQVFNVLKIPVAVPGWLPKGLNFSRAKIELHNQELPGGLSNYSIITLIYEGETDKSFYITSQDGGIGEGGEPEKYTSTILTSFGNVGIKISSGCVSTDYFHYKDVAYTFTGCNTEFNNKVQNSLTKDEAYKIIKSLKIIKKY